MHANMAAAAGAHCAHAGASWCQEEENLEVIKVNPGECVPERIVELIVDLAESSGANDTTNAAVTAVEKPVGEARPLGIAKHSAPTESELAMSSGEDSSSDEDEAESSWSRASCTTSTAATAAVAKSVGEVRPPRIAKRTEFRGDRIEADPQWRALMSRLASLRQSVGEAGSAVSSHITTSTSSWVFLCDVRKKSERSEMRE